MMASLCDLASYEPWRLNLDPAERSPTFKRASQVGSLFRNAGALAGPSVGPSCNASAQE